MRGNRFLDWFFRLLFPAALIGVIVYSVVVQPPLISSPEIKAGFAQQGSRTGYLEQVEVATEPWPEDLPPLLKEALVRSYGPARPRARSYYYFGTARRELWGIAAPVGFETLLWPGQGFSRQTGLSAFNFHFALWQTGMAEGRAWSKRNGKPGPTDPKAALSGFLLEQALLLLPLADLGPAFHQDRPGQLRVGVEKGPHLELEFQGQTLVRARVGENLVRAEKWDRFGDYTLPSVWSGKWGQKGLSRLEMQGLVVNPPFDREALDSAAR